MAIQNLKLIKKINLTNDVYELSFESEENLKMEAGQFITFLLPVIWWRAYSILEIIDNIIVLIIKKREIENGWRWWSKYICERGIWESLKAVWPAGHFLLKENKKNKMFIWTWTGLVPLLNQINYSLLNYKNTKICLLFWVRTEEDIFYIKKLIEIKKSNPNFYFNISISRVKDIFKFEQKYPEVNIFSWYNTNYLTREHIIDFEEFYICWAPNMIDSATEKLEDMWIKKENIFFEKY